MNNYLKVEYVPHGLRLELTPDGREFVEGYPEGKPDSYLFCDLFDDYLFSGWAMLRPEDIGALTGCDIILTDDWTIEDDGTLQVYGNIYWHERYQIESLIDRLLAGPVILPMASCGVCENPKERLNCGVPGVLAVVEHGHLVGSVERCDICQRFDSDSSAETALIKQMKG